MLKETILVEAMKKKRGGLQIRKPIARSELARLRKQGKTLKEIAAHFGCGINHITVHLRKLGLPLKWGGPTRVCMYPERYAKSGRRQYGAADL